LGETQPDKARIATTNAILHVMLISMFDLTTICNT